MLKENIFLSSFGHKISLGGVCIFWSIERNQLEKSFLYLSSASDEAVLIFFLFTLVLLMPPLSCLCRHIVERIDGLRLPSRNMDRKKSALITVTVLFYRIDINKIPHANAFKGSTVELQWLEH